MKVYVDDMLVNSVGEADHAIDLKEAFNNLRRHRIRLNPSKYMSSVTIGKFLGFMVTNKVSR